MTKHMKKYANIPGVTYPDAESGIIPDPTRRMTCRLCDGSGYTTIMRKTVRCPMCNKRGTISAPRARRIARADKTRSRWARWKL